MAPLLTVEGVTLQYGTRNHQVTATYRVSFNVQQSERFVILGPSGCGKSTLLKAVGGYVSPIEGSILLNGNKVVAPGPDRVFVFQEFDQLLPWKTVKENIVFALTASGKLPRREAGERAMHFIAKVKLTEFANSYPHTLSGGMKQRVAIARGMAMEPQILLMDEPFAALDAMTREELGFELMRIWDTDKKTVIFVTHNITEAILLADRVVAMTPRPGRIARVVDIDLARPRTIDMEFTQKFKSYSGEIREVIYRSPGASRS